MKKPYISLKIISKSGEMLHKIGSSKTKRIFHFIQREKFQDCEFEVCVTYQKDCQNAGTYKTKKDLVQTLRAFTEN